MAEQEYTPTEADIRDTYGVGWNAGSPRPDAPAPHDVFSRWLAAHDAEVRADERAKIEEERRREHAEASAQRVPPIVEMADGFAGSTKLDRLGIELMRVWGRVDKTSSVSQHPLGYVATFADMARAVLDWPELAEERERDGGEQYMLQISGSWDAAGQEPMPRHVGPFSSQGTASAWLLDRAPFSGSSQAIPWPVRPEEVSRG